MSLKNQYKLIKKYMMMKIKKFLKQILNNLKQMIKNYQKTQPLIKTKKVLKYQKKKQMIKHNLRLK